MPGYHLKTIEKGVYGEWSKVREEFQECEDSIDQGLKVMTIVELSDLVGAIGAYSTRKFNMSIHDLVMMASVTERAFKSGGRR